MTTHVDQTSVSANKQIPRLRFGYAVGSWRYSHKQLVESLRDGFNSAPADWIVTRTRMPSYIVDITIADCTYSIKLDRDRYTTGLWVLSVVPLVDAGIFYAKAHIPVPDTFIPGLKAVCERAHVIIVGIPHVRTPYWYFQWSDYRSDSTWTPGTLPWDT